MRNPILLVITLCVAGNALADALLESCDKCHGKNGISEHQEVPTIAGISAFAFEGLMQQYLDGTRTAREYEGEDMKTITAALSADELKKVAEHYAALPFVAAKQPFDEAKAAAGKAIHDAKCDRCHTEGGSYADDDSSILAGQMAAYLQKEMALYVSGERGGDRNMIRAFQGMPAEQIEALTHYYASQQ